MKWQKKLTKKEMKHVKDTMDGPPTLRGIMANRVFHKEQMAKGEKEPCYECRTIAIKLGLEA